ncbi:MAG: IS3 family transposase [Coprococcus eutactus]
MCLNVCIKPYLHYCIYIIISVYNDLLPMYVVRSMSRAGTPTDNSAMESINGWIKAELFMDFHVTGERPVYEEVNEYIKFFNEERPAYALSYLTPKQYRERYAA